MHQKAEDIELPLSEPANIPSSTDGQQKLEQGPPEGGRVAWLQVFGSFFLWMNTWGVNSSFGVFQAFYGTDVLKHHSASSISWIGSTQVFLLLLTGFLSGPLFDAGWFTYLHLLGSILLVLGLFTTSVCTKYSEFILAQSLCVGIGCGLLFVPSVAIIAQYFTSKKSLANGLASIGSGIGGVIYPIVFRRVQQRAGFGWAMRSIGFVVLATQIVSFLVMRAKPAPSRRALLDLQAFREPPFLIFSLGALFGFAAIYIPFFYISSFSIREGVTKDNLGFYMLPVMNAASIFGRVIPAAIADRLTGPVNTLIVVLLSAATLSFAWLAVTTLGGDIVFALLYGFFGGAYISLGPISVVSYCPDPRVVGTRLGMVCAVVGLGVLIGPPIAGAILRDTNRFDGLQEFTGAMLLGGAVTCLLSRLLLTGPALKAKV